MRNLTFVCRYISHASTLECLYDCLFVTMFLFYQNKLILILNKIAIKMKFSRI